MSGLLRPKALLQLSARKGLLSGSRRARHALATLRGEFTRPEQAVLKGRLRGFWETHRAYWEITSSSEWVSSPARERAAAFVVDGSSVLDIACGTGANAVWLADRCSYYGVDLLLPALRSALEPARRLACGDADQLPFPDAAFDAVIASYVLEHAVSPVLTLREMFRVVRPGGRIVLVGPSWDFPFWYPNALRSRAQRGGWQLRYTLWRLWGQLSGWWLGAFPFALVTEPDAFRLEFIYDSDAVYIVWTYEVVQLMKRWGCRLVHWEVDDHLLGTKAFVRLFKRMLMVLPPYRFAGSTVLLVFQK